MNTSYVGSQTTAYGEIRGAVLTGKGPTSYVQVTSAGGVTSGGDAINNPATGDYLVYADGCTTQSGNYTLIAIPTTANQLRAGAPSPSASGWKFRWLNTIGATEVGAGVNLSAEVVQFHADITQM